MDQAQTFMHTELHYSQLVCCSNTCVHMRHVMCDVILIKGVVRLSSASVRVCGTRRVCAFFLPLFCYTVANIYKIGHSFQRKVGPSVCVFYTQSLSCPVLCVSVYIRALSREVEGDGTFYSRNVPVMGCSVATGCLVSCMVRSQGLRHVSWFQYRLVPL